MVKITLPIVTLTGIIDVRSIADSYEKVKEAVEAGGDVEINLAGVTDLDLTLLQVIESARRSAALQGQAIRLSAPASGVVRETLERAGFLGGTPDEAAPFWLGAAA